MCLSSRFRIVLVVAFVAGLFAVVPSVAADETDTGPALTTPVAELDSALDCGDDLADASVDPVLLIHGTTVEPESNFGWNWVPALEADGIAWCTVALVDNGMGDIQDSAERVVHAVRTMAATSGRSVDIVGHSQGGMVGRWATKFWPDVRASVDDLVGLAPSNHGTKTAEPLCLLACAPAIQQQRASADFIAALDEGGHTFAGIDYTVAYTRYDAIVTPNLRGRASSLTTGGGDITNLATQDICPLSVADHLSIGTYDPVAYAIALDALDHDGPADAGRIDRGVCADLLMPGVDPATFALDYADAGTVLGSTLLLTPQVFHEPALRDYARA